MAIKRIWRGWTTIQNADAYQQLLRDEVFPGIEAKNIPGLRGIELLRLDSDDEVGFVVIMRFDSLQDLIAFQGEDYRRGYVPDAARALLSRYDEFAQHYEEIERRDYG